MLSAMPRLASQKRPRQSTVLLTAFLLLAFPFFAINASSLYATAASNIATSLATRISRVELGADSRISGIIILGGSLTRVVKAVEQAKRFPEARIILSGGSPEQRALAQTHLKNFILEEHATSTYENALYSRSLIGSQKDQCWLLVTSATHMPRSVGVFRAAGIPIAPWPVFDTPQSVDKQAKLAAYELKRLIAYRLLGRTDAFYPDADGLCHPDKNANPVVASAGGG